MDEESPCLVRSFSQPSDKYNDVDPLRALRSSVSFGRYVSDSSAWEKFSCFTNNRYLEEAEKIAKPGSVAEKKALLEAHFKKIGAKKANVVTHEHHMSNVENSTDTLMVLTSSETASKEINDEMQESRGPNVFALDAERAVLERDRMEVLERKTKTTDIAEKVIPSELPKSLEDEGEHTKNATVKQDKTPIIVSVKKNILRWIRPKPGPIAEKKALLEAHFKKIGSKKTEMGANIGEPSDVNNSCTDSLTVVKSSGTASEEVSDEMQNDGGLTVRDSDCGRGGLDKYKMKDMETDKKAVGILENVVTCQVSKPHENEGELTINVSNKQEMIPIMNHDHQRNLISTSKKNSSVCSSRLFKDIRTANLRPSIKHGSSQANEEDKATQTSNKGEKSTLEKKTATLKSLYKLVSNKQEMIPIMNHDHQRNLISTSKKNSSVCSSRLFKDIRTANLRPSIKHGSAQANEEDKATQTSNKGEKSTLEKKTATLKSLYISVDCSSRFSENTRRSTLMIQKDRDRNSASVAGTLVQHSTTIELQKRVKTRNRHPVPRSPAKSQCPAIDLKLRIESSTVAPTASSPFGLRCEGRVAQRKEYFQKLEEKQKAKEAEKIHLHSKSKVPITWPQIPKRAKPQTSSMVLDNGSRPPAISVKINDATKAKEESIRTPVRSLSRKNIKENSSPNLRRWVYC